MPSPDNTSRTLRLLSGPHIGACVLVGFVVRPAPPDRPSVLVQTPVNTLQAYNHWGAKSLYASNSTGRLAAVKVSFDRPVPAWTHSNLNAKAPFVYDVPLLRWLEREGFDVGYQTDVDTHRAPWTLVGRRLIVVSGHDEYWTREMRDAFDDATDRGVSLAFFGANTAYWQIRYEDDERTMVAYRISRLDPERDEAVKTVKFRDLKPSRDERRMLGVQYEGGLTDPTRLFDYDVDPDGLGDPWATGTGLQSMAPVRGVVGYEWDSLHARDPPHGLVRFLVYDGAPRSASCVRWIAPSGARVFSAGSLSFSWALDDWASPGRCDARVQQLVRNAFDDMLA